MYVVLHFLLQFHPVDVRNRKVCQIDDSVYKRGGRYAEVTVEVGPGKCGLVGPAGLQHF
jgi:hypothetical protein